MSRKPIRESRIFYLEKLKKFYRSYSVNFYTQYIRTLSLCIGLATESGNGDTFSGQASSNTGQAYYSPIVRRRPNQIGIGPLSYGSHLYRDVVRIR